MFAFSFLLPRFAVCPWRTAVAPGTIPPDNNDDNNEYEDNNVATMIKSNERDDTHHGINIALSSSVERN